MLVGNKIDLKERRVVTTAEGKAMAARIGVRLERERGIREEEIKTVRGRKGEIN